MFNKLEARRLQKDGIEIKLELKGLQFVIWVVLS
jgi:hypothetical protein